MKSKPWVMLLPNIVTVFGFCLTVAGSFLLNTWPGLILAGTGRLLDLADGWLARKFHAATQTGAALDASFDKLGSLSLLLACYIFEIAPLLAIVAMLLQNLANSIAFFIIVKHHKKPMKPSLDGKHAMFSQNLAVGSFAIAALIANGALASLFTASGWLMTAMGVLFFGIRATRGYYKSIA